MNKSLKTKPRPVPGDWDRRGLPGWTYHSRALFDLEKREVFQTHWQIAGHVNDIPSPGDYLTMDVTDERALVIRGKDGVVRGFHNLCRHRGARVAAEEHGHCKGALVCPFHGWVYNLDGTLRGAARPESFGDLDRKEFGLRPLDLEVWRGFIFIRFRSGPQPSVATLMAPFDADFAAWRSEELLPAGDTWTGELPVNWKSIRDVDNEGYHVAMAHPALQDLYGRTYSDKTYTNGISASFATFGDNPGRLWSVRNYVKFSRVQDWLPENRRRTWAYFGVFPSGVITFTPESANFYHELPVAPGRTLMRSRTYRRAEESRQARVARYLAARIDRETSKEDQMLSIWSNESMKSSAFEDFHLSDLEFGVKVHHDQLRRVLPVTRLPDAPPEDRIEATNENLRSLDAEI